MRVMRRERSDGCAAWKGISEQARQDVLRLAGVEARGVPKAAANGIPLRIDDRRLAPLPWFLNVNI